MAAYRLLLAWVLLLSRTADSARVLAVMPLFASSHHAVIQPILKSLAHAGHTVVNYSPFPLSYPLPNYTDVLLDNMLPTGSELDDFFLKIMEYPHWKCIDNMLPIHEMLIHKFFGNEEIRKLLHSKENFDLVITESFVAQEFTLIFGNIFNAPVIVVQTFFPTTMTNSILGNSFSLTSIPEGCFPYSNKMTFLERFYNTFSQLRAMYIYYNEYIPTLEAKMRKYVPNMPPLLDLMTNVSLMFFNDHLTADYAQPRSPNMIPVAGIHIDDEKSLPSDIKRFMDEAPDGVILFSLGTLVPDDAQPKEYFDMFVKVFKEVRQRVLWKTKNDKIEGLPENVMLVNWMPQRDVLAHPKCVLFITHGGLASQQETIYSGVPVVAIPYFADQHRNVAFYHAQQIGVRVLPKEMSKTTMSMAISTVLGDPKYRENIRRLSHIFKDRPLSPAKSVVFWTEYVMRHGGAAHLRPASTQLSWHQLALLDVLTAVLTVLFALMAVVFLSCMRIFSAIRGNMKKEVDIKKKSK